MKGWMLEQALNLLMPLLVGFLTPIVMKGIKSVSASVNLLPADVQRAVVVFIAGIGSGIATFLNVQVTGDITAWSNADVNTVLASAIAFSVHAANRAKATDAKLAAAKAEGLAALDKGESPFRLP